MRFDVGSFAEAEDQRGLAHFLEHMAFNGSTHVPEGEMFNLLERKGLAFGADTNASTGFDATNNKLDVLHASADPLHPRPLSTHTDAGATQTTTAPVTRDIGSILCSQTAPQPSHHN